MRVTLFALALIFFTNAAFGFEIEERREYPVARQTSVLKIISTADIAVFEPFIQRFQRLNPTVAIDYNVASSAELMRGIYEENATFDLAISSAMDLQSKIANDGFAQTLETEITSSMPHWAKWQNKVFAFTQEPAVLVVSKKDFQDQEIPRNRQQLIELLRNNAEQFRGRIGTYDVRTSGLGYLFATQDSRNTEAFWRLSEVMGRLQAKLYCCSGKMITDVANGTLALAYNVLGSYAQEQIARTPGIMIVELEDYVSVMLRTALIPANAKNAGDAGKMIDFLIDPTASQGEIQSVGLPPLLSQNAKKTDRSRPIRLGPGLLVFLDKLRRQNFLRSWTSAIVQDERQ